ncbi:hypothetical protein [Bradyrhizobium sp. BR 1432]|uniref:hypothetical protein n=1 Tax=Bradyrhizobium sp. BR 1432 TaxID=3447966 RepID=UPI003EE7D08A
MLVSIPFSGSPSANTVVYVAIVVPVAVGLGLGVALLIESAASLRSLYRTIYFLPVMATLIGMSIVWELVVIRSSA